VEASGPPRFLGDPRVHAPLSDPGGTQRQAIRARCPTSWRCGVAFRCLDGVGSHHQMLSGLHHAACTLAVYASRPRLPVCCLRPRKTRFRLVAHLGRTGLEPAGSLREVSARPTWLPPRPGLAWRTQTLPQRFHRRIALPDLIPLPLPLPLPDGFREREREREREWAGSRARPLRGLRERLVLAAH
jgi:hypothetical protein